MGRARGKEWLNGDAREAVSIPYRTWIRNHLSPPFFRHPDLRVAGFLRRDRNSGTTALKHGCLGW